MRRVGEGVLRDDALRGLLCVRDDGAAAVEACAGRVLRVDGADGRADGDYSEGDGEAGLCVCVCVCKRCVGKGKGEGVVYEVKELERAEAVEDLEAGEYNLAACKQLSVLCKRWVIV